MYTLQNLYARACSRVRIAGAESVIAGPRPSALMWPFPAYRRGRADYRVAAALTAQVTS